MKIEGIGLALLLLAGAYYVGKKLQPKPTLSIDAQEALAPAPYTTESSPDRLSPEDESNGVITLDTPATDGTGANILWDWTAYPDPNKHTPATRHDPRRKAKHPSKGPVIVQLGTGNIKNFPDMPKAFVHADGKTIGQHVTIWGGQEIQPGEDSPNVLAGLREVNANWDMLGEQHETPIFFRSDLYDPFDPHIIDINRPPITVLHNRESVTAGVTSAAFKMLKRDGLEFALVNLHMVVGGYNGKTPNAATRHQWQIEWSDYKSAILYHHNKGRTTFFTGDLNRPMPPLPYKGARWLSSHSGIDHVGVMHADKGVKFTQRGNPMGTRVSLHSDHDLVFVSGHISG